MAQIVSRDPGSYLVIPKHLKIRRFCHTCGYARRQDATILDPFPHDLRIAIQETVSMLIVNVLRSVVWSSPFIGRTECQELKVLTKITA